MLWPTPPSSDSPFDFWKIHFPTSYLFNCYFSALFFGLSSYFLTSGTSKIYSSIFCSCLLMMCFLETRIPVSAIFSGWRTSKSLPHLSLWPLFMSPSSKQKHKEKYFTLVLVGVLTPQAGRDEGKRRLQEPRRRELGRAGHPRACSNFQWWSLRAQVSCRAVPMLQLPSSHRQGFPSPEHTSLASKVLVLWTLWTIDHINSLLTCDCSADKATLAVHDLQMTCWPPQG